jgi:protein TonB
MPRVAAAGRLRLVPDQSAKARGVDRQQIYTRNHFDNPAPGPWLGIAISVGMHVAILGAYLAHTPPKMPPLPMPLSVRLSAAPPSAIPTPPTTAHSGTHTASAKAVNRAAAAPVTPLPAPVPSVPPLSPVAFTPSGQTAPPAPSGLRETQDTAHSGAIAAAPAQTATPTQAPPGPTRTPAEPFRAPRFDAAYLNNPAPAYPALARRMGEQGKVILRVLVNSAGIAGQVELRTSSGSPRLDGAALETVRHWRFLPARQGDDTIDAWVLVPVSFSLQG